MTERHQAASVHFTTCPLCEATCGLEVHVHDGVIQTIRGDKQDPLSKGYMCPKGFALKGLHEDPDRVKEPMIRHGDKWEVVTWAEAFEHIRAQMANVRDVHGTDAVGIYLGNPNVHNLDAQIYLPMLVRALKSKNRFSASSLDQLPKQLVAAFLYGNPMSVPVPDIDRTSYFLVLGANPLVSNGSMMTAPNMRDRLRALQQRGGKVVVVDPVRTRTAQTADEHHFIRPGTDAWFLLALLYTLYDEKCFALGHLEPHVEGFEAIEQIAKLVSPEKAQDECGIEADEIRRIARALAAADGASVYGRMGTCTQVFGTLTTWLIDVLNIVTGNLDRPGGVMYALSAAHSSNVSGGSQQRRGVRMGRFTSRVRQAPEILGELPTVVMTEEMETQGPGQIRSLITVAGNPVLSAPESDRFQQAISQLDFMVSVDFYLNETTRHADVFLPVPSPLERHHYDLTFYQLSIRNIAHYSPALFPLDSGQMHEWEVLLHLAAAVQGHPFNPATASQVDTAMVKSAVESWVKAVGGGIEQTQHVLEKLGDVAGPTRFLDFLLHTGAYGDQFNDNLEGLNLGRVASQLHGIDLGPLKPRIPDVLQTPSGKIEIAPEPILADVHRLLASTSGEGNAFRLVGRRNLHSNNSWMHNISALTKSSRNSELWMNEADAFRLEIEDGDIVSICSGERSLHAKVQLSSDVMPGVVSLPHGFGHEDPLAQLQVANTVPGANYNRLSSVTHVDPVSNNAALNGLAVTISK